MAQQPLQIACPALSFRSFHFLSCPCISFISILFHLCPFIWSPSMSIPLIIVERFPKSENNKMLLNKPLIDKAFKSSHHGVHQEHWLAFLWPCAQWNFRLVTSSLASLMYELLEKWIKLLGSQNSSTVSRLPRKAGSHLPANYQSWWPGFLSWACTPLCTTICSYEATTYRRDDAWTLEENCESRSCNETRPLQNVASITKPFVRKSDNFLVRTLTNWQSRSWPALVQSRQKMAIFWLHWARADQLLDCQFVEVRTKKKYFRYGHVQKSGIAPSFAPWPWNSESTRAHFAACTAVQALTAWLTLKIWALLGPYLLQANHIVLRVHSWVSSEDPGELLTPPSMKLWVSRRGPLPTPVRHGEIRWC